VSQVVVLDQEFLLLLMISFFSFLSAHWLLYPYCWQKWDPKEDNLYNNVISFYQSKKVVQQQDPLNSIWFQSCTRLSLLVIFVVVDVVPYLWWLDGYNVPPWIFGLWVCWSRLSLFLRLVKFTVIGTTGVLWIDRIFCNAYLTCFFHQQAVALLAASF
jgi:hypothetical protein